MKIFWSWQSDTHQPNGRYFVRDVLKEIVSELSNVDAAEDADRPEDEESEDQLQIDHDTEGVAGSPPIAETILQKIREAAVFIADVTPVGTTPGGKRVPNPNVMIELGYAMKVLGQKRIILVMNSGEGASLRHLPFDLRHWRAPLSYKLKRDAEDQRRIEEAKKLKESLSARLLPCILAAVSDLSAANKKVERSPLLKAGLSEDQEQPVRIRQLRNLNGFKTIEEVRSETPLLSLEGRKSKDETEFSFSGRSPDRKFNSLIRRLPKEQWNLSDAVEYNNEVSAYYKSYESYLSLRLNYERIKARTFELRFVISNDGSAPATDIDAFLEFPDGVMLVDKDNSLEMPEMPNPPGEKISGTSISPFLLPSNFTMSEFNAGGRGPSTSIMPDQKEVCFSVHRMKHHEGFGLEPVIVSFVTEADIAPFEVKYFITANEPIEPIQGNIYIDVECISASEKSS